MKWRLLTMWILILLGGLIITHLWPHKVKLHSTADTMFLRLSEHEVPELGITAVLYEHNTTGAKVCRILTDDENRLFSITFSTPPSDDAGMAHIIEHSVLCTSEKYKTKEPFTTLLKSSLNTFLNAFTAQLTTMYPVASKNLADLRNLASVYLDCVFKPKMAEDPVLFEQEGWHYHVEEGQEPCIKGVVYNEMKGSMSKPTRQLIHLMTQALFPDTAQGKESGGVPASIRELEYEDLVTHYRAWYHPSNSITTIYGSGEEDMLFDLLEEYFSQYERAEPILAPHGTPLTEPVVIETTYPALEGGDNLPTASFIFVLPPPKDEKWDPLLHIAMTLIDDALSHCDASPLRQKLIDGGYCKQLSAYFDADVSDPTYTISCIDLLKPFEELQVAVQEVLDSVVQNGFVNQLAIAAINTVEYQIRDMDHPHWPKGIALAFSLSTPWFHGQDPIEFLRFESILATLRMDVEMGNQMVLRGIMRRFLSENSFRASGVIRADTEKAKQMAAIEQAQIDNFLDDADRLEQVKTMTQRLLDAQNKEDTPEDIATIPKLSLSDVPDEPPLKVHTLAEDDPENGLQIYCLEQATNGILYGSMIFDVNHLSKDELLQLNHGTKLIGRIETLSRGWEEVALDVEQYFGSFSVSCVAAPQFDELETKFFLRVQFGLLPSNALKAFELIEELLLQTDGRNESRIQTLLTERLSSKVLNLQTSGERYSINTATSAVKPHGAHLHEWDGLESIAILKTVTEHDNYLINFNSILIKALNGKRTVAISANEQQMESFFSSTVQLMKKLPQYTTPAVVQPDWIRAPRSCAAPTSSQVVYNTKFVDYSGLLSDHQKDILKVVRAVVGNEYLWDEVRIKGGAYGCITRFVRDHLFFCSYRDPNVDQTYAVYENVPEWIETFETDASVFEGHLISVLGSMDPHRTPDLWNQQIITMKMQGFSLDDIKRQWTAIKNASQEEIRAIGAVIKSAWEQTDRTAVCTVGCEGTIKKSAIHFDETIQVS